MQTMENEGRGQLQVLRTRRFSAFTAIYEDTVSANLLSAVRDIEAKGLNPRPLVLSYLLAGDAKVLARGVHCIQSFDGQAVDGNWSVRKRLVSVNGRKLPVFDTYEESVLSILFKHDTLWEFDFSMRESNVAPYLCRYAKPWLGKYVKINESWGVSSMRNLRFWALMHDYGLPLDAILPYYGVKSPSYWIPMWGANDAERIVFEKAIRKR